MKIQCRSKAICGKYIYSKGYVLLSTENDVIRKVYEHQKECVKCQRIKKLYILNIKL